MTDDRRRERVAAAMLDFGTRVQYSVFECVLTDRRQAELVRRLSALMDLAEDSVLLYRLCTRCGRRAERLGRPPRDPDPPFVLA